MALTHDFLTINPDTNIYEVDTLNKLEISDDLIHYFIDSFAWLETYWNEKEEKQQGLNYYGYTIFKLNSIENFKSIVVSWKDLFYHATEKFELTGNYLPDENKYEKLIFHKADIIKKLDNLINLCDEAIALNLYILHMGI